MDVSIPVIDGWEATRRLKADPETAHIPIIALTAHALASDQQKAAAMGCDGYIPKPAEPRLVLAAVQRHLGLADGEAAA
jgi:CheY-like chemotaxis protein